MKTVLVVWTAALLTAAVCVGGMDLPTIASASTAHSEMEF